MKKLVLVALSVILAATTVVAQPPRQGRGNGERQPKPQSVETRVAKMDKALDLTDAQSVELTKLFTEQQEQMKSQRKEKREQGREQMQNQKEQQMESVKAILTPEQFEQFEKMAKRQNQQRRAPKRRNN